MYDLFWIQEGSTPAPNMTGRRFHCTTEVIPCRPWKSKSPFASRPIKISIKRGTRGVRVRYDAYFPHSFLSYGPPVVQSYWFPIAAEPPRNDSGADFQGNDSGFGPQSQSYRPKVGVTVQKSELQWGRPPESEPNRPEKEPESGLGASAENPP